MDYGKLTSNGGGGGGGKGDHWNTTERYGRDSVNFILSSYHFRYYNISQLLSSWRLVS